MTLLDSRAFQTQIPSAPLWLGLAGVLPFVWGALSAWNGELARPVADWLGTGFVGRGLQLTYGAVILSFMSGVLWGFACKAVKTQSCLAFQPFNHSGALGGFPTGQCGTDATHIADQAASWHSLALILCSFATD